MHRDFLPQSDNNEPGKVMNISINCIMVRWQNEINCLKISLSMTTYMVFLGYDTSRWPLFAEEIPFVQ